MHRLWTVIGICAIGLTALGFHLRELQPAISAPDDRATWNAPVDDAVVMQLLTRRLLTALQHTDISLMTGLLTPDYQEAPARWNEPTGYILIGNRKKFLRRYLNGRRAFMRVFRVSGQKNFRDLRFRLTEWLPQGDAMDCTLEARTPAGRLVARLRLYFSLEEEGWRLAMSDGLSLLAQLPLPEPRANQPGHSFSERILLTHEFNSPFIPEDRTFQRRFLLPAYRLMTLDRRVSRLRWRREIFQQPHAIAFSRLPASSPEAGADENAFLLLLTDPAANRLLYGRVSTGFRSYDARESGRPLHGPSGIAVDSRGYIYVADTGNGRILMLKPSGRGGNTDLLLLRSIGDGVLKHPFALAWDDAGTLYDTTDDRIWVLDHGTGELIAFRASILNPAVILRYRHENWLAPVAVAVGRFNGRNDDQLYVVDQSGPAIDRLYFDGRQLHFVQRRSLPPGSRPTALSSDGWGGLYLTDAGRNRIEKFAADLSLVSALNLQPTGTSVQQFQPMFLALASPSGLPEKYLTAQEAWLLEAWTDSTGLKRYALGLDAWIRRVRLASDQTQLTFDLTVTGAGRLQIVLISTDTPEKQFQLPPLWSPPAMFSWTWDRRTSNDLWIPSGTYFVQLRANSIDGNQESVREFGPVELPFYYRLAPDNNSSLTAVDLFQGDIAAAGAGHALRPILSHPEAVVVRMPGLSSHRRYEIRFHYRTPGSPVRQAASINGIPLHAPMKVGHSTQRTAWMAIPSSAFANSGLEVRIEKTAGAGLVGVEAVEIREANSLPRPANGLTLQAPQGHDPAGSAVAEEKGA